MRFDPQKHHRRSIRLQGYDYSQAGAYFVTLVARRREMLSGEIVNGEMVLNEYGRIADECWIAIPDHFPNVELGGHMVMPNHLHGIIVIHDEKNRDGDEPVAIRRGEACLAPTTTWCETKIDWCDCWIIQIRRHTPDRTRTQCDRYLAAQLWSLP